MSYATAHHSPRLITGASAGIGLALVKHWLAPDAPIIAVARGARSAPALQKLKAAGLPLYLHDADLTDEAQLAGVADWLAHRELLPRQIIQCAGLLHDRQQRLLPEKRLEDVNLAGLQASFALNAFAPILLAKSLLPTMPRDHDGVFACLSARVGSIEDNRLGGWYSYRASKAAQNQLLRTLAIETRRRYPNLCVLSLHPGTTDTALSRPYQRNVAANKLFSPAHAASQLARIIDQAREKDHGRFIAWDGKDIPW